MAKSDPEMLDIGGIKIPADPKMRSRDHELIIFGWSQGYKKGFKDAKKKIIELIKKKD